MPEWIKGFFAGEEIDCARYRELYYANRIGLVEEGLVEKMREHREECSACQAWVLGNAMHLFD